MLMCSATLGAGEYKPAPALITGINAKQGDRGVVTKEDLSGIDYTIDTGIEVSKKAGEYSVAYDAQPHGQVNIAKRNAEQGKWAESAAAYKTAAKTMAYEFALIDILINGADAYLRAAKPDDALEMVSRIEGEWPRCVRLAEVLNLKGRILIAKGDSDGAAKIYNAMIAKEKELGPAAAIIGVRGLAALARSQGNAGEAAKRALPLLEKIPAKSSPQAWAGLALEVSADFIAAKDSVNAMTILRRAIRAEIPSGLQAQAHLELGKLIAQGGDTKSLISAIDSFAIAKVLTDNAAVRDEAAKVGRAACEKVAKDATLGDETQRDYRLLTAKF